MPRFLKTVFVFLLGLAVAQAIATPMVYRADLNHLKTLEAIHAAGYLCIPNPHVFPALKSLKSAFFGGIFFTLTGGAFLTMISMVSARLWDTLFARKRIYLLVFGIPLMLSLAFVNLKGWSPFITLYILVIPPVVFTAALLLLPPDNENQALAKIVTAILCMGMIGFFLVFLKPADFNIERFVDFRDHFLLSNSLGKKINAFYYDNSLFSTQAFKSIGQQTLKTCRLVDISHASLHSQIMARLIKRDYLAIEGDVVPDLVVKRSDKDLEFIHKGKIILASSAHAFLKDPYTLLKEYEHKTDRFAAFRGFIMISMLAALAVAVYLPLFTLIFFILSRFIAPIPATTVTGVICIIAGLAGIFSMQVSEEAMPDLHKSIAVSMKSRSLTQRLSALKNIQKHGIEISDFPEYRQMAESAHIPERYWLAKALGKSRATDTHDILLHLLDDPHFNVVCMALSSLGQRNVKTDIRPIYNKIKTSDNWYIQWYGYKALRRLGWTQKKSG